MFKKVSALLIAVVLILSLAACGNTDTNSKSNSSSQAAETAQAVETQAAAVSATEAPAPTEADDSALIEETTAKLLGSWTYTGMEDYVKMTFGEDGKGSYKGLDDDFTFTYTITMVHKTFNNGEAYIDKTMNVDYSTGESEEIVIRFLEEGTETLTFSTPDGGGYSGVMTYHGGWIRA